MRFVSAYGQYSFESLSAALEQTKFSAKVAAGDSLVGYLWRLAPLILKLFAGASFSNHQNRPVDQNNNVEGPVIGIKLVAELWYNLGDYGIASPKCRLV